MVESIQHEEWRPVVGFEGIYEVSSIGRVRKAINYVKRCRGDRSVPGMVLRVMTGKNGYVQVPLSLDGKASAPLVHRLVAAAFIGQCPKGFDVNHKDFDRTNNRAVNLEYVSRRDNIQHAIRAGRIRPRELGQRSFKLTQDQVREIRDRLSSGETQRSIAIRFGINQATVSNIKTGKRRSLVA